MKRILTIALVVIAALYASACGADGSSSARDLPLRTPAGTISAGYRHTVGLRADGTAVATGLNKFGQCDVSSWSDLVAVSAGSNHSVGLRADGTAVATGARENGQCDVSSWSDLVAVSAGGLHTVGLRADGTAVAIGSNQYGQCDVSSWSDLVAISAGGLHTVGLRADGTALATGFNEDGRCDVSSWSDLTAVSAGGLHTLGLRADGTAVAVGDSSFGRCDVSSWKDLVAVSAGGFHSVGLRADGTPVSAGGYEGGQRDISSWKNLIAISAGYEHTVGLRADGKVLAAGDFRFGQCDVDSWALAAWPPPGGASATTASSPSPSPSETGEPGDPSTAASVYLLDGSGARESIISNASWAAEIAKLGGPRVRVRDMGIKNQTFLQDRRLVEAMPRNGAIVLIGLSMARFSGDPKEGLAGYDPKAVLASTAEVQHLYSVSRIFSDERKRQVLDRVLVERYPSFRATHDANAAALEQLIKACLARNLHPVLLELPVNLEIVGTSLDKPQATYRIATGKLAARYGIPYLDFLDDAGLVSGDFYDLLHLVEPGRVKWQKRLSVEVAARLDEYGIGKR